MLKKILIGLGIAIVAIVIFLFIVGFIGVYWITAPPKFEVKSIVTVDHDGYPAFKIVFETDKYPVEFCLMTPEGEKIYSISAGKPEKVVYLHLTPMKPYMNIVEEKSYVIKVLYLDKEIWKKEISVKGVKPSVEIVGIKGESYMLKLSLESVTIKIKNMGDVPLYITNIPENVKVYVDGEEVLCTVETATVLPNENKLVKIKLLADIDFDKLDKDHSIEVEIASKRAQHIIPKLSPELKLLNRKYKIALDTSYLDNVTISITNNWIFPIHTKWIRVFIDDEEYSALISIIPEKVERISVDKTVELALKLPWLTAKKGSEVEIMLGASKLEFRA